MSQAEFPYPQPLHPRIDGCTPLLEWMAVNSGVMSRKEHKPDEDLGRPGARTATVYPARPMMLEERHHGADLYEWGANHTFLPSTKPQTLGWRFPR